MVNTYNSSEYIYVKQQERFENLQNRVRQMCYENQGNDPSDTTAKTSKLKNQS